MAKRAKYGRVAYSEKVRRDRIRHREEMSLKILALAAEGDSYDEIARKLNYSPWTIRSYSNRVVFPWLGARNRPHAVAIAMRRGMIS